ncbi:MAG: tripartite tricarboxylate transporter TctB family protein [Synergistaceae bacterium]|nr:tripartite tricarboxylate transporter TctB family protein [Synergistaceae bacterium]
MKFNDAVFGIFFLIFSTLIMIRAHSLPSLPNYAYGAGFFPALTAAAMFVCGALLTVRGLKSGVRVFTPGEWMKSPKLVSNLLLVPLNLLFYIFFANRLGFLLTGIIMLTCTIGWLRRRLLSTLVISLCLTIFAYAFFYRLMMVPLPAGILGF